MQFTLVQGKSVTYLVKLVPTFRRKKAKNNSIDLHSLFAPVNQIPRNRITYSTTIRFKKNTTKCTLYWLLESSKHNKYVYHIYFYSCTYFDRSCIIYNLWHIAIWFKAGGSASISTHVDVIWKYHVAYAW